MRTTLFCLLLSSPAPDPPAQPPAQQQRGEEARMRRLLLARSETDAGGGTVQPRSWRLRAADGPALPSPQLRRTCPRRSPPFSACPHPGPRQPRTPHVRWQLQIRRKGLNGGARTHVTIAACDWRRTGSAAARACLAMIASHFSAVIPGRAITRARWTAGSFVLTTTTAPTCGCQGAHRGYRSGWRMAAQTPPER